MIEPGERVVAVWDIEGTEGRMAGWGTYIGDLACETNPVLNHVSYEALVEIVTADDSVDAETLRKRGGPSFTEEQLNSIMARREIRLSTPIDVRVADFKEYASRNPCIELDSGETVWGFECWWMTGEQFVAEGYDRIDWEIISPSLQRATATHQD